MRVRPVKLGYYAYGDDPMNHQRRYPAEYSHKPGAGEPFELKHPQDFSPNWMEIVEATPEERVIAEKRPVITGTIDMNTMKYAPAPGVKVRLPADTQLAEKHKKRAKKISEQAQSSGDEEVL